MTEIDRLLLNAETWAHDAEALRNSKDEWQEVVAACLDAQTRVLRLLVDAGKVKP